MTTPIPDPPSPVEGLEERSREGWLWQREYLEQLSRALSIIRELQGEISELKEKLRQYE